MDLADLTLFRLERLEAAVATRDGNVTAFGKELGYVDGAYIRQMLSGHRPVSEKVIRKVEELPGLSGWFEPAAEPAQSQFITQVRRAMEERDIPDHILKSTLSTLQGFPLKKRYG